MLMNTTEEIQEINKVFNDAEEMLKNGNDIEAEKRYLSILNREPNNIYSMFRLGEIYNRKKEPSKSYEYHLRAFQTNGRLAEKLTPKDHVSHEYEYHEVKEVINDICPLCSSKGVLHSCYNDVTNIDFIPGFSPIRLWMYCAACHHIFAHNYPSDLGNVVSNSQGSFHMKPNVDMIPAVGEILNRIQKFAKGSKLLDIGVGAGEFAAVAKEYLFDVSGLEIRKAYADQVSKNLNIKIYNIDFMEHIPRQKYDVVSMGDVLEHIADPVSAIKKVNALLKEEGVLWISTPNFDSAYSYLVKDQDPMWRVCEHLNYFSYKSLKKLLSETGFTIIDYSISKHYRGSMEVLAKKTSDCKAANKLVDSKISSNSINKLNLGCGHDVKDGWINLDLIGLEGVDVIADLDDCQSSLLPFEDNTIDEVFAGHIIEYINNPLPMMQELHRICKPEARAVFLCYYGSSDAATEDPAHARQYYLNSFGYFSQPFYWRADYGYRGDWSTEKITLYVDGDLYKGKSQDDIMDAINRERNVVKEMAVELKAMKPIREPKKELQSIPKIEILFV